MTMAIELKSRIKWSSSSKRSYGRPFFPCKQPFSPINKGRLFPGRALALLENFLKRFIMKMIGLKIAFHLRRDLAGDLSARVDFCTS